MFLIRPNDGEKDSGLWTSQHPGWKGIWGSSINDVNNVCYVCKVFTLCTIILLGHDLLIRGYLDIFAF